MKSRAALRAVVVAGLIIGGIFDAGGAQAAGADTLKSVIDAFIERMQRSGNGVVHWDGAESIDIRDDGADAVATITKGRIVLRAPDAAPSAKSVVLTFDRVEIRRSPSAAGGDKVQFAIKFPALIRFALPDDAGDVTLALKDASGTVVVEGPAEHQRDSSFSAAGGRVEHQASASWLNFGPVTSSWKISPGDNGGWTAPVAFEMKSLEFALPKASVQGGVERVAYSGAATGPNLSELDALRDRIAALRAQSDPDKKAAEIVTLLPKFLTEFANSKGELTVERVSAKRPDGASLVAFDKANWGGSISGLDGDKAALRFTLGHEGLVLDPSLLPAQQVPRRAVIDFGLEDISVATLRTLTEAASKMGPDATDQDKQAALPQLIAAAMSLAPVLHIYDVAADFPDSKIDATGLAKRGPPPPIGYTAIGDVTVHGFDKLPEIVTPERARQTLSLLKFLGDQKTDADGAEVVKFHIESQTAKPLAINGNDVGDWFHGAGQNGQMPAAPPRLLRLADPPETGDDVRAVQQAVKANEVEPFADGVYDAATAVAVARYQKAAGLNVSGVVDPTTAAKLGLKPPAKPPAAKN
jgi:hypothetical protein